MQINAGISRRRMLIAVIAVSVALLIVAALLPILFGTGSSGSQPPVIQFADPALSADPASDEVYMQLDRTVYYRTASFGYEITVALTPGKLHEREPEVVLLYRLISAAMGGDSSAYNACFSPEYIASSGKKEGFTKQKLYDITVTLCDGSGLTVPSGYTAVSAYAVSYKIRDNNGSLRDDIGSDAAREQIFYIVKDSAGNAAVYGVRT